MPVNRFLEPHVRELQKVSPDVFSLHSALQRLQSVISPVRFQCMNTFLCMPYPPQQKKQMMVEALIGYAYLKPSCMLEEDLELIRDTSR